MMQNEFFFPMENVDTCIDLVTYGIATWGAFYQYELPSIPAWIRNHIQYKVWDEMLIHSQILTAQPLKFGNG